MRKLESEIGGTSAQKLGGGSCTRFWFQIWGNRSLWLKYWDCL